MVHATTNDGGFSYDHPVLSQERTYARALPLRVGAVDEASLCLIGRRER